MKTILKVAVLSISIFCAFAFYPNHKTKTVVIDVGHGGKDHGAQVGDINEKDITLAVAKQLQLLITSENINLIIESTADDYTSLKDRVTKINSYQPDLLISLHVGDYYDNSKRGIEAFYFKNEKFETSSIKAAQQLLKNAPKQLEDSGLNEANFYLLKNSKTPAVLLNLGYLSNPEDVDFITSEYGQKKIAKAILKSL
ncbi:MAG: hypothetical protein BM564_00315 [Bacteroidetes bacterium MedPE-SWsnd-G2]|nr:MAG: hypothetical protein BM564_00315 [Bacteroidetes bacterium MedPE-SWsnd-G2]